MTVTEGASGVGLATFSTAAGDGVRVLDTFYPAPQLGRGEEPGTRELSTSEATRRGVLPAFEDELRGVRVAPVLTVVGDLSAPPADVHDAYLRLHLLSHRLGRPHGGNPDG